MTAVEHDGAFREDRLRRECPVLLVGEVNPLSTRGEYALYPAPVGCAGWNFTDRVARVSGGHQLATWRTNLCVGHWSLKAARLRAARLLDPWAPWSVVVMLGRKVASAFAYAGAPYTTERRQVLCDVMGDDPRDKLLVSLPHPSGLCREWNVPGAHERARQLLAESAPSWYGAAAQQS